MSARQANRLIPSQKLQLNASLARSLRILRFDAAGLTRYLEEQAAENPWITLKTAQAPAHDWSPRWRGAFAPPSPHSGLLTDLTISPEPGLVAHVALQIERLFPPGRRRQIAGVFLSSLEPSGWLGRSLAEIAREAAVTEDEAGMVLLRLQDMEPTGLFARSLAECLRLQAVEEGCFDQVMDCILQHLDLLASGNTARLATMCSVDESEILLRLRRIRSFDPKPGSRFAQGAAPVREPDLTARKSDNGWSVMLNRSSLPGLEIAGAPPAPDAKAKQLITAARNLDQMLRSRNETLLAIAGAIFARQPQLLDQGAEYLRPMTMAVIAEDLGHHESTVSRAIAGVSVDTPRGVVWLRSLFSSATGDGTGPAAAALRARLARLIASENPQKPLSDQMLAEMLATTGAPLARRTVAKYRGLLNIPPAHRRRQRIASAKQGKNGANSA